MSKLYLDYLNKSKNLSTRKRIEEFLNHILEIFQDNYYYYQEYPEKRDKLVYSELTKYGLNCDTDFIINDQGQLEKLNIKSNGFFENWIEEFKNVDGIRAYCDETNYPRWMQFRNGNLTATDEFEKIYLSLDANHIYQGVKEIMNFMAVNNIVHASKIADNMRNDQIVIRIKRDDKESLNQILNFVKNNSYIKEGMNQLNPFLPAEGNIAHIKDNNESYNGRVADYIDEFVLKNISSNELNSDMFINYVQSLSDSNVKRILISHLESFSQERQIDILNQAIITTYKKAGCRQVNEAIKNYVNNQNDQYFTRYNITNNDAINYREQLSNNLSSADVINIISKKLEKMNYSVNNSSLDEIINTYVSSVVLNYQLSILDQTVAVTCKNHDDVWAKQAMIGFKNQGDTKGFSRFKEGEHTNYRALLGQYVNYIDVYKLMTISLMTKGKNIKELDYSDMINLYVDTINEDNIKKPSL